MYCRKCGAEIKETSKFCDSCGCEVVKVKQVSYAEKYNENKKKNKELFKRISYELNTGANFSEALARQGNVFPKLLINMLKASELTGNLTETLDDMAAYYKTSDSNRKQIISALTYPSVVLVIAIIVLTFLLIFVVPQFESIFEQLGSKLPGITVFLISLSAFIQKNIIKIVLALAAIIIIIISFKDYAVIIM